MIGTRKYRTHLKKNLRPHGADPDTDDERLAISQVAAEQKGQPENDQFK